MSELEQEEVKSDSALADEFAQFLKSFKYQDTYKYFDQVTTLLLTDDPVFHLNYNDLVATENTEELCDLFHQDPDRAITCVQLAVKSMMDEINQLETEY